MIRSVRVSLCGDRRRRRAAAAGLATVILLLTGCRNVSADSTQPPPPSVQFAVRELNGRAAGTLPSLSIRTPSEGAQVSSPFDLEIDLTGITPTPSGQTVDGEGHLHVIIDSPCLEAGTVIPKNSTHIHWGDGSVVVPLELPPGRHSLCVQVGDGFHVAVAVSQSLAIEVTE